MTFPIRQALQHRHETALNPSEIIKDQDVALPAEFSRSVLRYLNVRCLIERETNGNVSAFAEKIGKTRESLARSAGKKYHPDQRIGDNLAEDIEAALGLADGYLDRFHSLPREVPPELLALLASARERFAQTSVTVRVPGTLPVVDWNDAGRLIDKEIKGFTDTHAYMLAPVQCEKGFFLQITSNEYQPFILPGMLLQVDMERKPTAEEAVQRPVFVLVKRPELELPVLRLVRAFGDLILYTSVTDPDPIPYYSPDEWEYGGMVVMRLIP